MSIMWIVHSIVPQRILLKQQGMYQRNVFSKLFHFHTFNFLHQAHKGFLNWLDVLDVHIINCDIHPGPCVCVSLILGIPSWTQCQ